MALDVIHLRKLLRILYAPEALRISLIRSDIRSDIAKEGDEAGSGGDFFGPFWADAKAHVIEGRDLVAASEARVVANRGRARLYPKLAEGFLSWWNTKRRWTNENLSFFENSIRGRARFDDLALIVKVDNLLSLRIGDRGERLIYPYFSERPVLSREAARVGLWVMSRALPRHDIADLRILDVARGQPFSTDDVPLNGNEESLFRERCAELLEQWEALWEEYY